jgi:drug/metabolite transporter (DMT)-like permease
VTDDRRAYLFTMAIAIIGSILFSGKAILVKLSYRYGVSSEVLLALRMILAFPLFWIVYYFSRNYEEHTKISIKDLIKLMWLGFSGYFLSSYLDFLGLSYISAGLERIVLYLTPAIVVLISYFFLHKPISRLQWISIVIGYLGVVFAFIEDLDTKGNDGWLGVGLVFASACLYANYLIFSGEMVKRIGSIRLVTYASSFSTLFGIIQITLISPNELFDQPSEVYILSMINALFCTVMPIFMIMISVKRMGSSLTAQSGILGPVSTLFMGWYFLQENISLFQICGLVLVIISVWLLMKNNPPQTPHT